MQFFIIKINKKNCVKVPLMLLNYPHQTPSLSLHHCPGVTGLGHGATSDIPQSGRIWFNQFKKSCCVEMYGGWGLTAFKFIPASV